MNKALSLLLRICLVIISIPMMVLFISLVILLIPFMLMMEKFDQIQNDMFKMDERDLE